MNKRNSYISSCMVDGSGKVMAGKGKNIILPPEKESLWKLYFEKFKDPIIVVLLVVFFLSCIIAFYEYSALSAGSSVFIEPVGVLIALLLATGVAFFFEVKANKEFEILNKVKDERPVKVFRRRKAGDRPVLVSVERHDVVVGDIVKLESGDEVPADGVLLDSSALRVDESNFTGELYANKSLDASDKEATYPCDFLLRGSIVIEGTAVYRVKAVGMDTEEGKGVVSTREGAEVDTPLNIQLAQLSKYISIVSFIIAALIVVGRFLFYLLFSDGAFAGGDFIDIARFVLASVMIAVTLIVVAVPEGLPMSVTVSLALSMRRMLKEKNLVRKLHACETMGAATVICTDKTGTLTKNRMQVMEHELYGSEAAEMVRLNIAINSTAELSVDDAGEVQAIGNPTECALLKWLHAKGVDYYEIRNEAVVIESEPFSTEKKYMSTTILQGGGKALRLIKGAPEIVMAMSSGVAGDTGMAHIGDVLAGYQHKAMRTLAFAYQYIVDGKPGDVALVGVVAIADPIRDDVKEAIETCRNRAGVRVIIVTGDTMGTANEIGRQIGLIAADEALQTITGPEFEAMGHDDALKLVKDPSFKIISRARPGDKARLVTLLQEAGNVVAVTGDGTNDAPALSKAHVGLSMGDGTSRAKEASDITIIDNSFSSINKAIMWGRSLYQNIRRFILFQMTINVCACLIVLLGAFVGLDSPLSVTQMLWVNLIMDTFAAMALSSLPADRSVLDEKPRSAKAHIINRAMLKRMLLIGGAFSVILVFLWLYMCSSPGNSVAQLVDWSNVRMMFASIRHFSVANFHVSTYDHAIFFSVFVMLQYWNLFNVRYFNTKRSLLKDIWNVVAGHCKWTDLYSSSFLFILAVIFLGQVVIVNYAGVLFGVARLSFNDWVAIIVATSPVLIIPEIYRNVKILLSKKRA